MAEFTAFDCNPLSVWVPEQKSCQQWDYLLQLPLCQVASWQAAASVVDSGRLPFHTDGD
jgi:hypothetical protein